MSLVKNRGSKSKPIVTVGVCVKNGQAFIGRAIKSIISQDYPHNSMEIIFVDDGSEDKTMSIIKKCAETIDVQVKIFGGKWLGLGSARNTVVNQAEGKYIVWVDSDMILSTDFIRKQVDFMEKNKDVGIAVGMVMWQPYDNPVLTLEVASLTALYSRNKVWRSNETTKLPGTAGTICRVDLLKKVGGFDTSINGAGEDQDIARKIEEDEWLICRTDATFYETHGNMSTWKDLWKKYDWYGTSAYHLYRRRIYRISIFRMNPFAGFISGILVASVVYPLTHRKIVFLCPIHFASKMFAWLHGFSTAKTPRNSQI